MKENPKNISKNEMNKILIVITLVQRSTYQTFDENENYYAISESTKTKKKIKTYLEHFNFIKMKKKTRGKNGINAKCKYLCKNKI